MMTRTSAVLTATIVVLTVVLAHTDAVPASPQNQNPPRSSIKPIETPPNGRYQIVNGTPEMTHNIMLLDTETGQTWEVCVVDKVDSWCAMHRFQEGETSSPSVQESPRVLPGVPER